MYNFIGLSYIFLEIYEFYCQKLPFLGPGPNFIKNKQARSGPAKGELKRRKLPLVERISGENEFGNKNAQV